MREGEPKAKVAAGHVGRAVVRHKERHGRLGHEVEADGLLVPQRRDVVEQRLNMPLRHAVRHLPDVQRQPAKRHLSVGRCNFSHARHGHVRRHLAEGAGEHVADHARRHRAAETVPEARPHVHGFAEPGHWAGGVRVVIRDARARQVPPDEGTRGVVRRHPGGRRPRRGRGQGLEPRGLAAREVEQERLLLRGVARVARHDRGPVDELRGVEGWLSDEAGHVDAGRIPWRKGDTGGRGRVCFDGHASATGGGVDGAAVVRELADEVSPADDVGGPVVHVRAEDGAAAHEVELEARDGRTVVRVGLGPALAVGH